MQFGAQEFTDGSKVLNFAESKGFSGTVMSVDDVIGANARPSWKLFYETTGAAEPTWNFKGKWLVSKSGEIKECSSDVEGDIIKLLEE